MRGRLGGLEIGRPLSISKNPCGVVTEVASDRTVVDDTVYPIEPRAEQFQWETRDGIIVFPKMMSWQEPAVNVGETVQKKQLLARGITRIYFQANVWIFTGILFVLGLAKGIGSAAVYKYTPEYFP